MLCIFQFEVLFFFQKTRAKRLSSNTADTMTLSLLASLIAPNIGIGCRHQSSLWWVSIWTISLCLENLTPPKSQHKAELIIADTHFPSLSCSKDVSTWPRTCQSDTFLLDFECKESPAITESAFQTLVSSRSPKSLAEMQMAGSHPERVWLSRSGVEPENLHF